MARLEAACERAVKTESFIEGMKRVAQPILYRNRADFAAFSRAESEKFRSLIEATGLRSAE
jgi:tripartite-type tricarboxylate transporter receptor subunit TctC